MRALRDAARGSELADRVAPAVSAEQVDAAVGQVAGEHGRGLSRGHADLAVLRADVLDVLRDSHLLVPDGDGFRLHAAAARYAPQATYAEGLF